MITRGAAGRHRVRVLQGITWYGRYTFGTVIGRMSGGMTAVGGHPLAIGRTVFMAQSGMTFS